MSILDFVKEYSNFVVAIGTLFAAITAAVALYLGDLRERIFRPKIFIKFAPIFGEYLRRMALNWYELPISIRDSEVYFYKSGFNSLVKIENVGRSVAKKVEVFIEKIQLVDNSGSLVDERYYHPSKIKWSGKNDFDSVDIVNGSYFFLDLFYSINETKYEIIKINTKRYIGRISEDMVKEIVEEEICPPGHIYWNVWIDQSYDRGVPKAYDFQGNIILFFILNSENHKPIRFKAKINWNFNKWNIPDIEISTSNR